MTPALTLARPLTPAPRFNPASLWLVGLVPGNAAVLLDLLHGVLRPGVWLARFMPALAVLALVAFAQWRDTPLAVRLRKELRLVLPVGVGLLVISGAGLLAWLFEGALAGLIHSISWTLSGVLVTTVLLTPFTLEAERGTLASLVLSPLGARALAEKYAVAALLVVASWAELSVSEVWGTELWWIGLAGHVVPLATAPTWFFLSRKDATSLGFVTMVPFVVVALPLMLGAGAGVVVPLLVAYMVVMLALLPRVVRRGVLAPTLGETSDVPGLPALERRASPLVGALLREQRESVVLGFVAVVAPLAVFAIGGVEEAPFVSFVLSACVAALSPGLAFSEPGRVGTLDHQLALRPRRRVFLERAVASLVVTLVSAGVVPLAMLGGLQLVTADGVGAWAVGVLLVWCTSLLAAVFSSNAGVSLVSGLGLAAAIFLSHFAVYAGLLLGIGGLVPARGGGQYLWATFVIAALLSLGLAWWRFVHQPARVGPRALVAVGASLFSAAAFGVAALF